MLANDGDGRLDLGHDAHVPQQLLRAAEILADGEEQRQAAFHVRVDVRLAMLDLGRIDQPAVDPIADDRLDVVRIGLDAKPRRRIGQPIGGRRNLVRLDEAHARRAVRGRKQPQKALAVAVLAADDLLLARVPMVQADELVDDGLHLGRERFGAGVPFGVRPIGVSAADDVADAVFVAVDGELVGDGQGAALVADLGQLLLVGEGEADHSATHSAAEAVPGGAVAVVNGIGRIDERIPKFVERFEQPAFEVFQAGIEVRDG